MLDREHLPQSFVDMVKRSLNVTWTDADTDARIIDMVLDAEVALNHKLGAEPDYSVPGAERRLFLAYLAYAWNQCLDEFDAALDRWPGQIIATHTADWAAARIDEEGHWRGEVSK